MLAACGGDDPTIEQLDSTIAAEPSSAATGTTGPTTTAIATTTALPEIPDDLAAFGTSTVIVGGETWLVAVADTPDERSDGLRAVEDLGDVDGMLFAYDEEVTNSFTMRDVTLPLEIGFFDGDGSLIDTQQMVPCLTDECPSYVAAGPFRWAIETFPGGIFGRPLAASCSSTDGGFSRTVHPGPDVGTILFFPDHLPLRGPAADAVVRRR